MRYLRKSARVVSKVLSFGRYRRLVALFGVAYLALFLYALQNITSSTGSFSVVTADPSAVFRRTGFLLFDAVAVVTTPLFTLLVSPINIAMGLLIAFLVGLNLTMSVIAWRQPRACRTSGAGGVLGILPGLLAGGACCAPTILMILGIQATAALLTAVQWMIPVAFALLIASLLWITQKTEPELMKEFAG